MPQTKAVLRANRCMSGRQGRKARHFDFRPLRIVAEVRAGETRLLHARIDNGFNDRSEEAH